MSWNKNDPILKSRRQLYKIARLEEELISPLSPSKINSHNQQVQKFQKPFTKILYCFNTIMHYKKVHFCRRFLEYSPLKARGGVRPQISDFLDSCAKFCGLSGGAIENPQFSVFQPINYDLCRDGFLGHIFPTFQAFLAKKLQILRCRLNF